MFILSLIFHLSLFFFPAYAAEEPAPSPSLSLQEAVTEGLHANRDLLAAQDAVPMAEADELTAGLWDNPSILIDAGFQPFGGNWDQSNAGGPKQNDLVLSYPVDLSGKRSAAKRSAHQASKVAEAAYQDQMRQKVLQIRLAYIDLLDQEQQLTLSKERAQSLTRLVEMMENRVGGKTILPLLLRRAQLARDQAGLEVRQKESAIQVARSALAALLGRGTMESGFQLSTKLRDFQMIDPPDSEGLINKALDQRPDLQALHMTRSKSDADLDLAKAQTWDNFIVSAGLTRQGPTDANPHDPTSSALAAANSWSLGVTIPLPVFNRNQGNVKKAQLSATQSEKQIAALKLSIRQEISADLEQLRLGRKLIEEYEKNQLKSARQIRDSQQKLFGTGGSGILDYFDATSAYQTTLSSYYDAVADYRRNWVRLDAALGKDWLP